MTKDLNKNIDNFFPDNTGNNEEIINILNKTSQILFEWFSESNHLGPLPEKSIFKCPLPNEVGCDAETILNEIKNIIYSSFNPSHPGSLAHLDPPPLAISIVGDLIAGGLNNNLLAEELSPSISLLENEICRWFANKIGYSDISGGIAASGGTLNNLNALVTARYVSGFEYDSNAAFLLSKDAHVSFKKCARILGLKEENIILVDTDLKGRMDIKSLKNLIDKSINERKKIFAVIATLGTTIRGAIDPIKKISDICRDKNIWLHIDGSIGGIFTIGNSNIDEINNVNLSNSITINPQKLLGITKTSSLLLVSDINTLHKTFKTGLPYLEQPFESINRGELGVQGSRPAEIIKLWLGLRFIGLKDVNTILNQSILKRLLLENNLDSEKFEIYSGPLHIISFLPKNMDQHNSDIWTLNTKKNLLRNQFMISRPTYLNRYFLRVVFGNYNTSDVHILKLADLINNQ